MFKNLIKKSVGSGWQCAEPAGGGAGRERGPAAGQRRSTALAHAGPAAASPRLRQRQRARLARAVPAGDGLFAGLRGPAAAACGAAGCVLAGPKGTRVNNRV